MHGNSFYDVLSYSFTRLGAATTTMLKLYTVLIEVTVLRHTILGAL